MRYEEKLKALGLELPEAPKPVATYVPAVRTGNLLFFLACCRCGTVNWHLQENSAVK